MEKYKSYGTLSKTTHFLSVFCEAGVAQQCTEAQASVVQDELSYSTLIQPVHTDTVEPLYNEAAWTIRISSS